ncbi:hypothetical protein [Amycolatopsis suaedae]|uniref:Uncharacterized protein n=1 Tax=Amycolatopsis suaedae TaxID=2510978 RepID=A0A4Q7IZ97_9PSEU|nr:hypothetical protein [Amycolatopsis suaedae]RZQ59787.1 hypothetical protein EWH70_32205 [Amycolatopsis suaedae]
MVGWLCAALGVAFGSAIIPLINVELFILGLVASDPDIPWLALGIVVAAGQLAGKLLYYLAARGSIHLPKFLHDRLHRQRPPTPRRERWRARTKRIRSWLDALRERCQRHPAWMTGTYGLSAITGIPPYMATTVLAGLVHMPMSVFLGVGFAGRAIRFCALAASPALFSEWLRL